MNCDLVELSAGVHQCRQCRRGWHGEPKPRECHAEESTAAQSICQPRKLSTVRVGMLMPNWCAGGVERYHEAICKWTSQRIEWAGLALTKDSPVSQRAVDQISRLMPAYRDGNIQPVLDCCDVLLTWAVPDLAGLIGDFPGRVVAISHGDGQWLRSRLHPSCDRATDFVAVSREAANAFPDSVRDRVVIQPAGIEIDRISPSRPRDEIRSEWGVRPDQIALGYVGRFSPEKNPLHLARIVAGLSDRYVAVYHGHNPWGEEKFRREAIETSKGKIVFVPPTVHTGDVYAGIDRLIQASDAEGGPLVAIEAWLTGVPLVTTPVGIVADDDDLRACSEVVPIGSTVERWQWAVQNEIRYDTCPIAFSRYSAAAASRRWENYLIGVANGNR